MSTEKIESMKAELTECQRINGEMSGSILGLRAEVKRLEAGIHERDVLTGDFIRSRDETIFTLEQRRDAVVKEMEITLTHRGRVPTSATLEEWIAVLRGETP